MDGSKKTVVKKHGNPAINIKSHKRSSGLDQFPVSSSESDKYLIGKDFIWKDVITHERKVQKEWEKTWAHLITPVVHKHHHNANNPSMVNKTSKGLLVYRKSSEIIGSRTKTPELQERESIKVNETIPKIRFVSEQYGAYRRLHYLKNVSERSDTGESSLPSSKQRHNVNPLLC